MWGQQSQARQEGQVVTRAGSVPHVQPPAGLVQPVEGGAKDQGWERVRSPGEEVTAAA